MGYLRPAPLDAEGEAFAALYRRHFGLVWSLTLHLGVPAAAREDVAQEVWMTIHRRMGALRQGASVRAWVASITRHVVLHHRRADGRRDRKHAALTVVTGVCEEIHEADAITTIDDTLRAMDPAQRETFVLVAVAELTGPEVAEVLGVPLNTVYSRLRLARARLAVALSEARADAETHEAEAMLRDASPSRRSASRVWLALVADLGWRKAAPLAATATTFTGKLAVVATSALATVLGTAALGGFGDRSAHAGVASAAIVPTTWAPEAADASEAAVASARGDDPPARGDDTATEEIAELHAPAIAATQATRPRDASARAAHVPHRDAKAHTRVTTPRPELAATPEPAADAPTKAPPVDGLAAEAALLARARRALKENDPARARIILTEHATTFAEGRLAIDRRALWARMLCAAGDAARARAQVQSLLREHPGAAAAVAVRDVCAE